MKQAGNVILILLLGTAAVIGGKMLWDKFKPMADKGTPPDAGKPKPPSQVASTTRPAEASLGFSSAAAGSYCCKDPLCFNFGSRCKCFNPRTGGYSWKKADVCAGSGGTD